MKYKILLVIIILFLSVLRLQSAIRSMEPFYLTLQPIFSKPHASYDEKMSEKYPLYFDFIKFIKNKTSETSTIYIPDISIAYGGKLWAISSSGTTSALLFPRKIVYFDGDSVLDKNATGYVVIVRGEPSKSINTNLFYLINNNTITTFLGNYYPKNINNEEYGLIKL